VARATNRYKKQPPKVKPVRRSNGSAKSEHFVLFFSSTGAPKLRALEFDARTDTFKKLTLDARATERRLRAEESLAGQLFALLTAVRGE